MTNRWRLTISGLVLTALIGGDPAWAQEVDRTAPSRRQSPFNLAGEGDLARTSMRIQGEWMAYNINSGPGDDFGGPGYSFWGILGTRTNPTGPVFQFFGMGQPYAGAPRGEWLRHVGTVPTLSNALPRGSSQGWTSIINLTSFGEPRQFLPADGQFGGAFRGVSSTEDGSCLDHSQRRGGYQLQAGDSPLLAGSNCPPTWPTVGGVPTFLGAHPIPAQNWIDVFNDPSIAGMTPEDFEFSWWRIPPELHDQTRFFGDFATYGKYNDFNSTTLPKFGNVVPGQSGDPILTGWPLGLEFTYDAWSVALPTLQNVYFWRAILVNESEQVYGVGLDYDSLYVGFAHETGRFQEGVVYFDPVRNTIWSAEGGTSGTPNCNGGVQLTGAGNDCDQLGFVAGATALTILKSPIGDMRNKLFSEPTSEFFDPTNPFRGDTITFNHGHLCDYGFCFTAFGGLSGNPRKMFGFYSSTHQNLLFDLNPDAISAGQYLHTFWNPLFPDQRVPFAHTVPGHSSHGAAGQAVGSNPAPEWSYSRRPESAPAGPDTLWFDNCGPRGCSVVWSDTMAAPGRYINQEANNGMFSIGPFRLAAGDTVGLVMAIIGAPDSAALESYVANAIDFYMGFYRGPEGPPTTRIVGTSVTGTDAFGVNPAAVTLFFDDVLEDHVDPFLLDFAESIENAAEGTAEFRLRQLNPDLVEDIRARAQDNVARMLLFKSCDGGSTFTSDADCDPDPAVDISGRPIGAGWQAYAEFTPSADGRFPNTFSDPNVLAGRSYLYVITAESRGARFIVVDSVDTTGDGVFDRLAPDTLFIAPQILNPLASSTSEPNVVSVYVPASAQAGGRAVSFTITPAPEGLTSFFAGGEPRLPLSVSTAGTVADGEFQALIVNRVEVTERRVVGTDSILSVRVVAADVGDVLLPGGGTQDDFVFESDTLVTTNPSGVSIAGEPDEVTSTVQGQVRTRTLVFDGLALVLVNTATGEPLLVSTVFQPGSTTPGTFFGRSDFPGFVVDLDQRRVGEFLGSFYTEGTDTLVAAVNPSLQLNTQLVNVTGDPDQLGEYILDFTSSTFGPGAPFRLDRLNPDATQQAFEASLAARQSGEIGLTDEATAELIGEAIGAEIAAEDLVPVRVPFEVRNATFDRDVDVAMLERQDSTMLLGDAGDTVRVTIPRTEWVPGDQLFFIESVTTDSTAEGRIVVDAGGQPIQVTRRMVTLADVAIGCGQGTCNPVIGPGSTQFLDVDPDMRLHLVFNNPVDLRSEFTITAQGQLAGRDILERGEIRSLSDVLVVPNPYLVFSHMEVSAQERRIMFTNLPPRGVIRIYTATGGFLQELTWTEDQLAGNGDLFYNLRTQEGNELAAGLYVFVVKATDPASGAARSHTGKFVIIR